MPPVIRYLLQPVITVDYLLQHDTTQKAGLYTSNMRVRFTYAVQG